LAVLDSGSGVRTGGRGEATTFIFLPIKFLFTAANPLLSKTGMFARFAWLAVIVFLSCGLAWAAVYPLSNGTTIDGDPISYNAAGVVLKKPDGTFLPRESWTNFTQQALGEFNKDPKAKIYVEPFLDVEEPEGDQAKIEIKPKDIERLERPGAKAGLSALFASGISLTFLLLVYAANIYAGFEVGLFRNYPPLLTAGVAAVAPVIGPIVFLCLPTRLQKSIDDIAAESMARAMAQAEAEGTAPKLSVGNPAEEAAEAEKAAAEAKSNVTVYQRGQTSFNRRFFETKFAGFLRPIPGDEEKDKEIYIRSARGEYVGPKLTRILQNELTMQVQKGDATNDVIIPFGEIYEVQVRPRAVPAS
jgi:hypothetical protein